MKLQQKSWILKDVLLSHSGPQFDTELQELKNALEGFERFLSFGQYAVLRCHSDPSLN